MRCSRFHILCVAIGIALSACEEQANTVEQTPQKQPATRQAPAEPAETRHGAPLPPPVPGAKSVPTVAQPQTQLPTRTGETHTITCESIAYKMPNFVPFLQQFKQAVAARDVAFIYDALADDVKFDFGGGYGKNAFMRHWGLDGESAQRSDFWQAASTVLELGGYEQKSRTGATEAVVFPCTFQPLPEDNWIARRFSGYSAYDYMVVTEDGAPFTDADGYVLRTLSAGETLLMPNGSSYDTIRTYDGLGGYVSKNDIRSPVDYRMFFIPIRGQWKITLFIRGD